MSAALVLPEIPETAAAVRPTHSRLNDVVAYGIASLLLFSPLAFGAVEPWAVFVIESVSAILFAVWMIGQMRSPEIKVLWAPIFPPMLVFAGIALLQLALGLSA